MDIIIKHNNEINNTLKEIQTNLKNTHISKSISDKLAIVNKHFLEISETLNKLNINIKNNNQIELSEKEKEFLNTEKESNELISKIMPLLTVIALS